MNPETPTHVGSLHKLKLNRILCRKKKASPVEDSSAATDVVMETTVCKYKLWPLDGRVVPVPPPMSKDLPRNFLFIYLYVCACSESEQTLKHNSVTKNNHYFIELNAT